MKILDIYILKKFLSSFVYVVLIVVTILCVIDFTEKSDDFIRSNVSYSLIFGQYYLNYIPYISNMFSPISIFIATVFVTSKMATHTEIIAILSSGVSFKRILVPYLIGSSFVGVLIFFLTGWIIPNANKSRIAFENQYLHNKFYFKGNNVHMKIGPNVYAYMESYNNNIDVGYQFSLETIEGTDLKSKLKASKITWQAEKKNWLLDKYSIRKFEREKEILLQGKN